MIDEMMRINKIPTIKIFLNKLIILKFLFYYLPKNMIHSKEDYIHLGSV